MSEAKPFILLVGILSGALSLGILLVGSPSPTIHPAPADRLPDTMVAEVTSLVDDKVIGTVPVARVGDEWVGSGVVAGVPVEIRTPGGVCPDYPLPGLPRVNVRLRYPLPPGKE